MSLGHGLHLHSRVNPNRVSTQGLKNLQLLLSLVIVWLIANETLSYVFNEQNFYWQPRTLITLAYLISTLNKIYGEVGMNRAIVFLDNLTKSGRAAFEGYFLKLQWETPYYEVDLEAELTSDVPFTFPTNDGGTIRGNVSILSKPESAEGWPAKVRSERMLTYVKYEHEIEKMQKAHAEEIMLERFAKVNGDDAKKMPKKDILEPDDFLEIAYLMAFRVEEINIKDLEYGDETQETRETALRAAAFIKVRKLLRTPEEGGGQGLSLQEANDTALLMAKDTKFQKTNYGLTLNGLSDFTPEAAQAILEFAKNLKSKP